MKHCPQCDVRSDEPGAWFYAACSSLPARDLSVPTAVYQPTAEGPVTASPAAAERRPGKTDVTQAGRRGGAARVTLRAVLATVNVPAPGPVLAAGAALLLTLRVGRQKGRTEVASTFNTYIGGLLPAGVLYAVVLSEAYGHARFGLVGIAALAGLLPAVLIRWQPWRRVARGGPVE